ncbi:MAG: nickel pincer cofactor biosynthesis protein LarC [Candidatus Brocadiaceae bacterium]|nr:nickel pincer cofactor biosynthesis protein LarC [Candidatus Brocadiaceae bacterium]
MKTVYFDCFSGVSGDMTLGAFVDAGLDINLLQEQLALLKLDNYEISAEKVKRAGIAGTRVHIKILSREQLQSSGASKHSTHLSLSGIQKIIEKSTLHQDIKSNSIKIFCRLAAVEAKVHNTSIEEVHFHEVGAMDSIMDIVGSAIALQYFGIKKVYFSPIPTGSGYVACEHGTFPVPAPATAELLKTYQLKSVHVEKELTTPTGAAILTTLGTGLHTNPEMRISYIGYGAGSYDNPSIPNLLRIFIGETAVSNESDEMWIVETNIDDMSGEVLGYAMEKLFEAGAVDVYLTPIQMKKGRPGTMISAIVSEPYLPAIELLFFQQTTTFGIRKYKVARTILTRESRALDCQWGKIQVKIGKLNNEVTSFSPEYEDCKRVAEEQGIPLKQVYSMISKNFYRSTDP